MWNHWRALPNCPCPGAAPRHVGNKVVDLVPMTVHLLVRDYQVACEWPKAFLLRHLGRRAEVGRDVVAAVYNQPNQKGTGCNNIWQGGEVKGLWFLLNSRKRIINVQNTIYADTFVLSPFNTVLQWNDNYIERRGQQKWASFKLCYFWLCYVTLVLLSGSKHWSCPLSNWPRQDMDKSWLIKDWSAGSAR